MAHPTKRKVSVTLDADLVEEVERAGGNLSARVNTALRKELAHERHLRALGDLLDRLAEERGPLDTAEDEAEIQRYMGIMRSIGSDGTGSAA